MNAKEDILADIRRELRARADAQTQTSFQRFFKEPITCYGVKTPVVVHLAQESFKRVKSRGKKAILLLCQELLQSDYAEEAMIAFDWSYRLRDEYTEDDINLFESWLKTYVNNWAKCDTLCNHTMGTLVSRYPGLISRLKEWAHSENRWLRRGVAVTLILPAREGQFVEDIFEIAETLLRDKDDLVQKGYGWLLKEASRRHTEAVFQYVMQRRATMPRTALRYAIELLPAGMKHEAMEKP